MEIACDNLLETLNQRSANHWPLPHKLKAMGPSE